MRRQLRNAHVHACWAAGAGCDMHACVSISGLPHACIGRLCHQHSCAYTFLILGCLSCSSPGLSCAAASSSHTLCFASRASSAAVNDEGTSVGLLRLARSTNRYQSKAAETLQKTCAPTFPGPVASSRGSSVVECNTFQLVAALELCWRCAPGLTSLNRDSARAGLD